MKAVRKLGRTRKTLPFKIRKKIYDANGGLCVYCGVETSLFKPRWSWGKPASAIDHIKPVKLGGTDDEENLQLLCITCNSQKGAKLHV